MKTYRGQACGKFILLGDHFVVHGTPALSFPVRHLKCSTEVTLDGLARNRADILRTRCSPEIEIKMREVFEKAAQGLGVSEIVSSASLRSCSNFRLSRGFGSSAALSAAMVRLLVNVREGAGMSAPTETEVFQVLQDLERIFHTNPSGVDAATIWHEKALNFQRTGSPEFIENHVADFVLVDSGVRRATSDLVRSVSHYRERHSGRWAVLAEQMKVLVWECREFLRNARLGLHLLSQAISEGHGVLSELGLSNDRIEDIIYRAKRWGGLAGKVCGAGTGGAVAIMTERGHGLHLFEKMKERRMPVVAVVEAQ